MTLPFAIRAGPAARVYRVGRKPDPFEWPDWASAGPMDTFANRYDDPEGIYRVLYVSSQRVGAFVETLARYRPGLMYMLPSTPLRDLRKLVRPG
jgi:hypothetical protein